MFIMFKWLLLHNSTFSWWLCLYGCISESGQLGMWPPRVLLTAVTAGLGSLYMFVCACVCVWFAWGCPCYKRRQESWMHSVTYTLFLAPWAWTFFPCFASSCLILSVHHCPPTATRARRKTWLSCSSKEHFVWIIAHFLLVLLAVGVLGLVWWRQSSS